MNYYGACFEPYVGPFVGSQPVLYNAYTKDQVVAMLTAVNNDGFKHLLTYGQGVFVWQGKPLVQDSNKFIIEAAAGLGQRVSAGCYQQGANPGGDSFNVAWTKAEIDYAIDQAKKYKNVEELLITNESIWGPGSLANITSLLAYAKGLRGSLPISVTTHQRWDVLAGVDNHTPSYAPIRQGLLTMLAACETCIYANVYPYFDSNLWAQLGTNPTEAHFKSVVTASLEGTWQALLTAFQNNGITLECRIGEIGWPTQGSQAAQPHPELATPTYAKWHYDAVATWLAKNGVKAYLFEAIDEPWKGNQAGNNSEAYFGKMVADGSATNPGSYTLRSVKAKY